MVAGRTTLGEEVERRGYSSRRSRRGLRSARLLRGCRCGGGGGCSCADHHGRQPRRYANLRPAAREGRHIDGDAVVHPRRRDSGGDTICKPHHRHSVPPPFPTPSPVATASPPSSARPTTPAAAPKPGATASPSHTLIPLAGTWSLAASNPVCADTTPTCGTDVGMAVLNCVPNATCSINTAPLLCQRCGAGSDVDPGSDARHLWAAHLHRWNRFHHLYVPTVWPILVFGYGHPLDGSPLRAPGIITVMARGSGADPHRSRIASAAAAPPIGLATNFGDALEPN